MNVNKWPEKFAKHALSSMLVFILLGSGSVLANGELTYQDATKENNYSQDTTGKSGLVPTPHLQAVITPAGPKSGTVKAARVSLFSPEHDDFDEAYTISILPFNEVLDISQATQAADDPLLPCAGDQMLYHTVWYRFTAGADGLLEIDTFGSDYDTVLATWTGERGSLVSQGCNDQYEGSEQSYLLVPVSAGTTYHIQVAAISPLVTGMLLLQVSLVQPPPNDDFENALPVSSPTFSDSQETRAASTAADDPLLPCAGDQMLYHTVWYRFTAGADGLLEIDTFGSDYDTVLATWTGEHGSLVPQGCNDQYEGSEQSYLLVPVSAGTTYHIQVAAAREQIVGMLQIAFSFITPPDVPVGVSASDGAQTNGVAVSWEAVSGATYYEIYRHSGTSSADAAYIADNTTTSYNDTSALPGTLFSYWVKACNAAGCSIFSNYDTGWRALTPPGGVTASDGSLSDRVRVNWNATNGANYYQVWRHTSASSSSATLIATDVTKTSYDDGTATTLTPYYYWIKACTSLGCSTFSNPDMGWRSQQWLNDDFDKAIPITAVPFSASQNIDTATSAKDDPRLPCADNQQRYRTVWYKFTPTTNGTLMIDTFGSDYDTILAVWSGSRGSLVSEGCNDDASGITQSLQILPYTKGTTYYIEVAAFSAESSGTLIINASKIQSTANDDINNAITISSLPYRNNQDISAATQAADDPRFTCSSGQMRYNTVWYRYTAAYSGALEINTFGSDYDTVLAVWSGSRGQLVSLGCNDDAQGSAQSRVAVPIRKGRTYFIEVAAYSRGMMGTLNIFTTILRNDDFDEAINISSTPYSNRQEIRAASTASDDPSLPCARNEQRYRTVWYKFTPSINGRLDVDTFGSTYDTVLAIWTGARGTLSLMNCNDNETVSNNQSRLVRPVIAGTTYYIEVAAYKAVPDGTLNISANFTPMPPNDDIGDALVITSVPYTHNQFIDGATTANNDPKFSCSGNLQRYSTIWYKYTPTGSGTLTVSTLNSTFDTVLAVWKGVPGSLNELGCNDDAADTIQSQLTVPINANTPYYIQVAAHDDEESGTLNLSVSATLHSAPTQPYNQIEVDSQDNWPYLTAQVEATRQSDTPAGGAISLTAEPPGGNSNNEVSGSAADRAYGVLPTALIITLIVIALLGIGVLLMQNLADRPRHS